VGIYKDPLPEDFSGLLDCQCLSEMTQEVVHVTVVVVDLPEHIGNLPLLVGIGDKDVLDHHLVRDRVVDPVDLVLKCDLGYVFLLEERLKVSNCHESETL
jgi:hypothetical protein